MARDDAYLLDLLLQRKQTRLVCNIRRRAGGSMGIPLVIQGDDEGEAGDVGSVIQDGEFFPV